jgi:hypothetical protein
VAEAAVIVKVELVEQQHLLVLLAQQVAEAAQAVTPHQVLPQVQQADLAEMVEQQEAVVLQLVAPVVVVK